MASHAPRQPASASKSGSTKVCSTSPSTAPVKSAGFSRKELKEFRVLLLRRKILLAGDVAGLEREGMKKGADAAGDLSTLPMHLADLGTDSFEQDISLGRMESESDEIKEIDEALERIGDGSFGLCDGCQKRIPKNRLQAIPYTRLCVSCKIKEENV